MKKLKQEPVKEREFTFNETLKDGTVEQVKYKESELTIEHKSDMLGFLLKAFYDMPGEVQFAFFKSLETAMGEEQLKESKKIITKL